MGHAYAMKGAGSFVTPVSRLKEVMGGMTQVCTSIQVANGNFNGQGNKHIKNHNFDDTEGYSGYEVRKIKAEYTYLIWENKN